MEHAQLDVVTVGQPLKILNQCNLCPVKLPVACKDAAIFVAVGVAQHDVLLGTRALDQIGDARQCIELTHDACRVAQVFDRFKQRNHDQVDSGVVIQCAAHQANFFLKQQDFQQVTDCFGVADDVVTNGLSSIGSPSQASFFKNRQLRLSMVRVVGTWNAQGPCVV